MLGEARMAVNASTVRIRITVAATATATPPITTNSRLSNAVSLLKWAATPRQRCNETQTTSVVSATASGTSSSQPVRSVIRSWPATHARVMVVSPNDSPKVVGLRNETGPAHAPPTTSQATRWARPARMSAAPTR
jgi:hypothetical protein